MDTLSVALANVRTGLRGISLGDREGPAHPVHRVLAVIDHYRITREITSKLRGIKPPPYRKVKVIKDISKVPAKFIWSVLGHLCDDLKDLLPIDIMLSLRGIIRNRNVKGYVDLCKNNLSLSKNYDGLTIESVRAMRLLTIAEKFMFDGTVSTRRDAALEKFYAAESQCAQVNELGFDETSTKAQLFEVPIWDHARYFIKKTLGNLNIGKILKSARHGPGANLGTRKQRTSVVDKYAAAPLSVTEDCFTLGQLLIWHDVRWLRSLLAEFLREPRLLTAGYQRKTIVSYYCELDTEQKVDFWNFAFKVVDHNRVTTVPKNSLTDRTIAIEPDINLMLQLGVDEFIKGRLNKIFGIDLSTQEKNQILACLGSITDLLVTLDLSAASDTIALAVIKLLFPREWYKLLIQLRAPFGKIGDVVIEYHKLSSMGNGCTFSIETLVFASLIYGVVRYHGDRWADVEDRIAVYGDDLIVPVKYVDDLKRILFRAGFKVNNSKSFESGSIRESCGKDYFKGYNIRPVHFSANPQDVLQIVTYHNLLYRWADEMDISLTKTINYLHSLVPPLDRGYGPPDVGFMSSWLFSHEPTYTKKWFKDWQVTGWEIPVLSYRRKKNTFPPRLSYYYGYLAHDLSDGPPRDGKDKFNLFEPSQPTNRYSSVGRNCSIELLKGLHRRTTWCSESPYPG